MQAISKIKSLEHIKLVIVFVALNMLDAILTNIALNIGAVEVNPITRYLFEQARGIFWTFEIGSTALVVFIFWILGMFSPRMMKIVLIVSIIYMTVVCLWNGLCLFNLKLLF